MRLSVSHIWNWHVLASMPQFWAQGIWCPNPNPPLYHEACMTVYSPHLRCLLPTSQVDGP